MANIQIRTQIRKKYICDLEILFKWFQKLIIHIAHVFFFKNIYITKEQN